MGLEWLWQFSRVANERSLIGKQFCGVILLLSKPAFFALSEATILANERVPLHDSGKGPEERAGCCFGDRVPGCDAGRVEPWAMELNPVGVFGPTGRE